jgi:Fe-S cluster assembly iron-binding protein IscA
MEFLEVDYAREAMESGFVFGNCKAGFVEDFA